MAEHLRAELVVDALDMAAKNGTLDKEAIFHSDRGTQYTSATFRAALATHGMRQSMGRTGVCWDNALAESFFGTQGLRWSTWRRWHQAQARRAHVRRRLRL